VEDNKLDTLVVISAYQRPEKLQARYREVKAWTRLDKLIITIDGLRAKSGENEFLNRKRVIEVAEEIALNDNRVDVLVWNENSGVNNHAARLFTRTKHFESMILVEDDVGVNEVALNFLYNNVQSEGSLASTAHVSRNHPKLSATSSRSSLFPNQWGLALTRPVMETYLDVIESKHFYRHDISRAFYRALGNDLNRLQIQRLVQWWFNHFFFCERHGNWADALIQYSVYVNRGFYRVPAQSLIVDDNSLNDPRSMNPRERYEPVITCEHARKIETTDFYTCYSCEISNSRLNEASARNLIGATRYRKSLQLRRR
jgi:hypothetical protein